MIEAALDLATVAANSATIALVMITLFGRTEPQLTYSVAEVVVLAILNLSILARACRRHRKGGRP